MLLCKSTYLNERMNINERKEEEEEEESDKNN
jgi:hypothetical protein